MEQYRSNYYALLLSIIKDMSAKESLLAMGISEREEGKK